jgi:hypothetical protein
MMMSFIFLFSLVFGSPITNFIKLSFSTKIKNKALCLAMMVTTKSYPVTVDEFGLTRSYYSFAPTTFFGVLFLKVLVPTKNQKQDFGGGSIKGKK